MRREPRELGVKLLYETVPLKGRVKDQLAEDTHGHEPQSV
jgi:hypothetical protein